VGKEEGLKIRGNKKGKGNGKGEKLGFMHVALKGEVVGG
jgi:hypothetical protein